MARRYDKVKRRIVLAMIEHLGVILWGSYSEYNRLLRWYGDGMTERERAFLEGQVAKLKDVTEKLTKFRGVIYDDVKHW